MIEVRCNRCNKFLFEVSDDAQGTVGATCLRCKVKRQIVITEDFKRVARQQQAQRHPKNPVAVNEQPR